MTKLKAILSKIKNLWKTEGQEHLTTPQKEEMAFTLKHQHLVIGQLTLKEGVWTFWYSEEFKNQNKVQPLSNFPNKDKVYSSEQLYPFFLLRIPSLKQPKIQKIVQTENIDEHNEALLLKRFGEYSISNPFRLLALN